MTDQRRYPKGQAPEDLDDNITLDEHDDRWEWRRRIRSNPATHRAYRTVVAVLGLVVVVIGLIAVPAPGPGWLIVFIGVSIWASEFEWAQRLLYWGNDRLRDLWLRDPFAVDRLVISGVVAGQLLLLSVAVEPAVRAELTPLGWPVIQVDPPHSLLLRSRSMPVGTYAFVLDPLDDGWTRLIVRDRATWTWRSSRNGPSWTSLVGSGSVL